MFKKNSILAIVANGILYINTKKDALSKGDAPYQKNKLALIKSIFYGYRNWFKKYDYMAFSDTSERKRMNNKYQNKLLDFIIDEVGNDKVLLVEDANPYHLKLHEVYTKRIVSFSGIKVLIYALKMLIKTFKIKIKIDGTEVLDKIKNDNNLDIDYISLSRHQLTYYLCMKLLFILYKPKAIFVTDHYSNYPLIKAAKDLKIKVIECQHGLISREHPAYNFDININSSYLPDFLLSFGDYIVNTLKDSRILDVTQIVPVGSLYLEYMREYYKPKTEIKSLFNNYKK
ncbi:hypothetical protein EXW96_22740 [Paenibacillus sp. JMULE4]|uniref:hypothetical protein n=1 Tax=Paenibacillus sp. JMULE4 TaxID=2518342 RepID=UPI0015751968|nr:hypothetical protein [Paenibacillus sp. JMULE4]NTZ20258.1 hypothetical protein [Paenibacillus sp. JMULE4]